MAKIRSVRMVRKHSPRGEQGSPGSKERLRRRFWPAVMNMEDDVMKGVVLQVLREVKTMTVDELKDHLSSKKDSLAGKNSTLNVYWSRTNSRCKYLLDPATPDTANFYFTSGTWNTRMAAAFIGSWLMVTQRCLFFFLREINYTTALFKNTLYTSTYLDHFLRSSHVTGTYHAF